jgi:hypothetical protein
LLLRGELNAYDVLCNDWVVFTRSTLPGQSLEVPVSANEAPEVESAEAAEREDEGKDRPEPEGQAQAEPEDQPEPEGQAQPEALDQLEEETPEP